MGNLLQITSTKNERIKALVKLKKKKYREEAGLFLIEGEKSVGEAIASGSAISQILLNEEQQEKFAPILEACDLEKIELLLCSPHVMDAVGDAKTSQGILAVASSASLNAQIGDGMVVVLEDVADPQNVGTIIRTADAVGAGGVILTAGCADFLSPKAIRASMGSIFHIPIVAEREISHVLEELKSKNMTIVAGHLQGRGDFDFHNDRIAIVVGNESRGVSHTVEQMADVLYKIPIYGQAESLNVAVAAGILLYAAKGVISL